MHLAKLQTVTLFRPIRSLQCSATATHSRVIRLRRVLTDFPPSGSSIDPASVAV